MRVLIHNSDSPENRGDRAILVGVIELVRRAWPDAEIWSLSQYAERDERWYGIRFLPQSPYSLNPLNWIRLSRLARRSDIVLWGGGEILKDYTNKLGLVYWFVKIWTLRLANRNIAGVFQGIGPTSATISKRLIKATVECTRVFVTRDEESTAKLRQWGVRVPVVSSFDPAVLGAPAPVDDDVLRRLRESADLDLQTLDGAIGLGLRRWFHYQHSGWIPQRFKSRRRRERTYDDRLARYRATIAEFADRQIEQQDRDVVFFPMHMEATEGDVAFAASIVALMRNPNRARIIARDVFSSPEYAGLLGHLLVFVASRLHSSILATRAGVPSCVYYYVDKGRLYFEQIGMQAFSAPIESVLDLDALAVLENRVGRLIDEREMVRERLEVSLAEMSTRVEADFGVLKQILEAPDFHDMSHGGAGGALRADAGTAGTR